MGTLDIKNNILMFHLVNEIILFVTNCANYEDIKKMSNYEIIVKVTYVVVVLHLILQRKTTKS